MFDVKGARLIIPKSKLRNPKFVLISFTWNFPPDLSKNKHKQFFFFLHCPRDSNYTILFYNLDEAKDPTIYDEILNLIY